MIERLRLFLIIALGEVVLSVRGRRTPA